MTRSSDVVCGLRTVLLPAVLLLPLMPVAAQDSDDAPRRTRVILGPQLVPRFPGSDDTALRPYVDVSRTHGDAPFDYEAPDESSGVSLHDRNGLSFGPVFNFEGKRRSADVGGLDRVGFTVELGAAIQYRARAPFRAIAEVRKGLGGHRGVIGMVGVDYVARDGDRWLLAIGPRLTAGDARYARAYFGVSNREAMATGVRAYRPDSYLAVGATTSALRQLSDRWGVFGYAKYDRLLDDAAASPVTGRFGSRDQLSGGLGLSYTFGRR